MFYSKKWLSNDGRLREPWIQGNFGGRIPHYVNTNRNQNVSQTCSNILEVVRSKSKKIQHRISLKLSAELSCGTCYMYKNGVNNLFEDCFGVGTSTSLGERPLRSTDFTVSSVSSDLSSPNDAAVYGRDQSTNALELLADVPVRNLQQSSVYEEVSEGEIIVSEDNTLPMDVSPENNPTMLLPENIGIEATGNVNVFEEFTLPVVEKSSNMYEITDDDFAMDDQGILVSEETESQPQKQAKDLEDTSNRHENTDKQMEVDFGKSQLIKMVDISGPSNNLPDNSSATEECMLDITPTKTLLNDIPSEVCLQIFYCPYESSCIANPCPVDSNADDKKTTRQVRLRDKRITRPISLIKGRIRNPKCHTKRKPDIRHDDCLQGKQINQCEDNVLGEKSDVSDKQPYCVDTSEASDATLGSNNEDVTEMQNVKNMTIFKKRALYNITEEETVISNNSSDKDLLYINMSSEITQINQSPPTDSNVNIPSEDQETLPNHSDVSRDDVSMEHDSSTDEPKNRTDVNETVKVNSTHSTINVLFPMYLKGSFNPEDIRVITGPIFEHIKDINIMDSDVESSSSVFRMDVKQAMGVDHNEADQLDKEWGEAAVYTKLVVLWRHMRLVTPEKLFGQDHRCRNMAVARARMFHSLLCLKSRDLVRCLKDAGGQLKYITKGKHLIKLNPHSLSD